MKINLTCECGHNHTREFILNPISFLSVCPVCGREEEIGEKEIEKFSARLRQNADNTAAKQ